jgi:hypothetical protein
MSKKIQIVFKSGAVVLVQYSYAVYNELAANIGQDHKVEAKSFSANTKDIDGIFFINEDAGKTDESDEVA